MEKSRDFKILVVDDDPHLHDIISGILKKNHYKVLTAINAAGCMKLLNKEKPDIILLNVSLPDADGNDICKQIKSDPEYSAVYIILISPLISNTNDVSDGLEDVADGYIKKPVDTLELLAHVKSACRLIAAESKAIKNEMLLNACIDSPRDMIVLAIDRHYNYLAFNSYHEDVMRNAYGKEINIGMNLLECITNEQDVNKSKINYDKAMEGEGHITVEEYGELDRQYYETRYNPVYDEKNNIIGATAFSSSITSRKKMEDSLKRSEEKFRKAFNTSPDAININRLSDGMYVSINDGFTAIMGYTWQDVIGKTSIELNIWDNTADRDRLIKVLKTDGRVLNMEGVFRRKDKSVKIGLMSASIIDLDGVQHILSITRDITDHKIAIDALQKRNAFIQAVIDNLPIGLAVNYIDSGDASYMNKKFSEIYGWPSKDLTDIAKFFEKVYPDPEYRKEISKKIMEDITSGDISRMHWDGIKIHTKHRGVRYISATNIPIPEQNIMISTVTDITDLKHSEDTLKKKIDELEFLNDMMVNREIKMLDLKKEINDLLNKLGEGDKYIIHEKND